MKTECAAKMIGLSCLAGMLIILGGAPATAGHLAKDPTLFQIAKGSSPQSGGGRGGSQGVHSMGAESGYRDMQSEQTREMEQEQLRKIRKEQHMNGEQERERERERDQDEDGDQEREREQEREQQPLRVPQ